MNRLDRLYALVEELRAAGLPGRSARRLAERFEVSVRTIERDILALQEAGVPISAQLGRRGGYVLDRSMTLPPLNFSPAEVVAMAVGLRRLDDTPFARDARTALLKVVAAMPDGAAARARTLADGVRLLVQPLSAGPVDRRRRGARRRGRHADPHRLPRRRRPSDRAGGRAPPRRARPERLVRHRVVPVAPGRARLPHRPHPSVQPLPGRSSNPSASSAWRTTRRARRRGSDRRHRQNTDTGLSPDTRMLGAMTHASSPPTRSPGSRSPPTTPTPPRRSTATCSAGRSARSATPRPPAWTTGSPRCPEATPRSAASWDRRGDAAHAVFYIAVTDVAATCEAEQLGGKVVSRRLEPAAGRRSRTCGIAVGSLFGVFTPAA